MPPSETELPPATTAPSITATPAASPSEKRSSEKRSLGVVYGITAYSLWGLLPLYFLLLIPASAVEIVASRVVFSLIFCALILTVTRGWPDVIAAVRTPRILGTLAIAAALIAVNWLIFTYGITTGHAIETALGYFINPLVSVLLGVLILKEKLRPLQWAAMGIGFIAVIELTIAYGQLPWIALMLALTFGVYGFVKNRVGQQVSAATSLSVETAVLTPFALVGMVILSVSGTATLTSQGAGHFWWMAASGVITAVPLLFFAASARRLPMTTIGLLQYFAPVLQFLIAVLFLHEQMGVERWVGFCIVWLALILLTADMLIQRQRSSRLRQGR
ncbi:EamA family transporter RarD [Psychromicrobium xiongbiense]|uniref:EamA family transporter RarD n=1 Tax=Psychromicrobium xiongbiense TaxID=3051184 RepID=UPI003B22593E